ncbi:MAG: hypothetical protein JWO31_3051 [Phycisphaerales bacterium]|nr:hypothetical protein [Phycisphaerales bacterium]
MGLVLLDVTFRAERAFGVRVPRDWHERLDIRKDGDDATLAQYHAFLLDLCREQGVEPPRESWRVLLGLVEDASGEANFGPETRLIQDIAP